MTHEPVGKYDEPVGHQGWTGWSVLFFSAASCSDYGPVGMTHEPVGVDVVPVGLYDDQPVGLHFFS